MAPERPCATDGCERVCTRRRFCPACQKRREADVIREKDRRCIVEGCCAPVVQCKWMCAKHHDRLVTKGDVMADIEWLQEPHPFDTCRVEGCERHRGKGRTVCEAHRARQVKYGQLFEEIPIGQQHHCQDILKRALAKQEAV